MKILVLGSNGMAGSMISKYLTDLFEVEKWDRQKFNYPCSIPDLSQYDYVINCIGLIKQKSNDPILLNAINNVLPHELAASCKKLIHLSSDCVFSGKLEVGKSYSFFDVPDAEDDYGKSKAEGEKINAMILRTSIIGPAKDNYGLFEWFRHWQEDSVYGYVNHWWSGITTLELAKAIFNIIDHNYYEKGIKQLASEPISKYDLLQMINTVYSLNKNIVPFHTITVNRSLAPTGEIRKLERQIYELKEYEKS